MSFCHENVRSIMLNPLATINCISQWTPNRRIVFAQTVIEIVNDSERSLDKHAITDGFFRIMMTSDIDIYTASIILNGVKGYIFKMLGTARSIKLSKKLGKQIEEFVVKP